MTFSGIGWQADFHILQNCDYERDIFQIRSIRTCPYIASCWKSPLHFLDKTNKQMFKICYTLKPNTCSATNWGIKTHFFTVSPKDRFPDFAGVDQSPPALRKFGKFPNIATLEASTWRVPNLAKRHLCTRCSKLLCFSKQQPQQQQIRQRHATGSINKEQDTPTNNKPKQQWAFGQMDTQTKETPRAASIA